MTVWQVCTHDKVKEMNKETAAGEVDRGGGGLIHGGEE